MKISFYRFAVVLAVLIGSMAASAQVPRTLTYEGMVRSASGTPVSDGMHTLLVRLYRTVTGGAPVLSETHSVVTNDGAFSVTIGDSVAIADSLSFDAPYYLGVSVDAEAEEAPRVALSAVPYALSVRSTSALSGKAVIPSSLFGALFSPTGRAGGDLSGSYPAPVVTSIGGRPVSATKPDSGAYLVWNGRQWSGERLRDAISFGVHSQLPTFYLQDSSILVPSFSRVPVNDRYNDSTSFSFDSSWYIVPEDGIYEFNCVATIVVSGQDIVEVMLSVDNVRADDVEQSVAATSYPDYPLVIELHSILTVRAGQHVRCSIEPVGTSSMINIGVRDVSFSGNRISH